MKIVTWNMEVTNKHFKQGFEYIFNQNPDVVCLQEVSNQGLDYLKNTKFKVHNVCNAIGKNQKMHKVILTKNASKNHQTFITFNKNIKRTTIRKIILKTLGISELFHNAHYVDLGNNLRIFNLHQDAYAGPKKRIEQFEAVTNEFHPEKHNIVCGDFNSYGNLFFNSLLFPAINMPLNELKINEKKGLYKIFKKHNFQDIFKGHVTWPLLGARLQIDHMLIPNKIKVNSKEVVKNRFTSDHRMLIADINL
ncbi:endonuclease/exonuclease/phosphatase family protein [archaeon]|jgi:endonuclease/exonuclease/phosphatase family metal-dependent hydrolase|nr:endonuclease/exonuclease/phosphatase family protein [archaeon]MBT4022826.1 endonuclease/exonuclease/phosphatase family protein [archaeon]MBT4272980.1 endonuclease/exonuclease/phosphatase family protein [archaeon]MBT4460929.1 endonuclease/exonuclease/phosphatase family protein [archaeon]MBT4858145.1 endonuclease/exonuclease/phosphatase family protein [archaeon]